MHPKLADATEEIEEFCEQLDRTKEQCKAQEIIFVLGDFNVRVGTIKTDKIFGPFGLGDRNERGEALAIWCRCYNMVLMNTWFKNHSRKLYMDKP